MRVYLGIFRALSGSSKLMSGFLVLLMLWPVILRWLGLYDPNLGIGVLTQNGSIWILWFIGLRLGSSARVLWRHDVLRLLPGNQRRVMTASVLLGLAVWGLVVWSYCFSGVGPEGFFPWQRWVPLWGYGALGAGFLGGVFAFDTSAPTRVQWVQSIKWVHPVVLVFFAMTANATLRSWLNMPLVAALPGVTPLAVACLLLGPLTWRFFVSGRPDERRQAAAIRLDWKEQLRLGGAYSMLLPFYVKRWHSRARPRLEFLVLSPTLLNTWTTVGFFTLL